VELVIRLGEVRVATSLGKTEDAATEEKQLE